MRFLVRPKDTAGRNILPIDLGLTDVFSTLPEGRHMAVAHMVQGRAHGSGQGGKRGGKMAQRWTDFLHDIAGADNPRLGIRFDATGRFLPERGNTVVAHVIPGSPTEVALIDLRAALQTLPEAHLFAFTIPESYHMTVFEGVIETRRQARHWPAGIDPASALDDTTMAMAALLENFGPPPAFSMRVAEVTPFGLNLTGATASDEAIARAWRDALADCLGLRSPGHEDYGFHTTLAYAMRGMPVGSIAGYQTALAGLTAAFQARVPVLHLSRPAFCRFEDMNGFPVILPL